ncbi:MAG: hypothetical protein VB144_02680 [Clostridia bacterium]|nr:hypothetical protein [Clostridia bacterium]
MNAMLKRAAAAGACASAAAVVVAFLVCLPAFAQPSSLVGSAAPRVSIEGAHREIVAIPSPGKVTVVLFWNSRYRLSVEALAALGRIWDACKGRGLVCAGLSDVGEDASVVRQAGQQAGVSFPLAGGTAASDAAVLYRVRGVPVLFVINRSGQITYVREGWDGGAESDVSSRVMASL